MVGSVHLTQYTLVVFLIIFGARREMASKTYIVNFRYICLKESFRVDSGDTVHMGVSWTTVLSTVKKTTEKRKCSEPLNITCDDAS